MDSLDTVPTEDDLAEVEPQGQSPEETKKLILLAAAEDANTVPVLSRALEHERDRDDPWTWRTVGCHPDLLRNLSDIGLIKLVLQTDNGRLYRLTNPSAIRVVLDQPGIEDIIKPGLFDEIVGYDDEKEYVKRSLTLTGKDKVHVLLTGHPGSAKSLFLDAIRTLPGSLWMVGSSTKKAGLVRYLMDNGGSTYHNLLIDEADKMKDEDQAALLTLMESQRIAEMKSGRVNEMEGDWRVYAAGNREEDLLPELITRFAVFHFDPYTEKDYIEVTRRMLMLRNYEPEFAVFVAEYGWANGFINPRDAVRVAVMAKGDIESAQWAFSTLRRFR